MKKLGRKHRPFFRICAIDGRAPRDGRVIEELGHYDPMITETDARASLNGERIDYWLSVGAQPSDKVKVLIDKYGTNGSHLEQQRQAQERIKLNKPTAPPPRAVPKKKEEPKPEEAQAAEETQAAEAAEATEAAADSPEATPSEGGE
jgi:small subunit ribosomal protein S16